VQQYRTGDSKNRDFETPAEARCTTGCTGESKTNSEADLSDPDLADVVTAWPGLPEAIRAGIVAMVRSASGLV